MVSSLPEAGVVRRWALPFATGTALILLIVALSIPGSGSALAGPAAALQTLIESLLIAGAWLLGALGLGTLAEPLVRRALGPADAQGRAPGAWSIQLALGVGLSLWIAHAMGVLGAWRGGPVTDAIAAWGPVALGIAALAARARRGGGPVENAATAPLASLVAIIPLAVMLVAACAPPGSLWRSEALGFDVLAYHLQLPREWLERGRVEPLGHNVYSWLPGYIEAAYAQVMAMAAAAPLTPGGGVARGISACQCLHALLGVSAAAVIGRFTAILAGSDADGTDASARRNGLFAGAIAATGVLSVPWTVVVSSLAYNEMAMVLSGAGAMALALIARGSALPRGLLIGALVGAACGAKPTALFLVGGPVAVVLAMRTPVKQWAALGGGVMVGGLAFLAPWLARNWMVGGNPLFPFFTDLFGSAHWTQEQAQRWDAGHHFDGSWLDRVALLFSPRGVLHEQWSIFFFALPLAAALSIWSRRTRGAAVALCAGVLVQVAAWMSAGHLQSRFLLPVLITGGPLLGLGSLALLDLGLSRARAVARPVPLAIVLIMGAHGIAIFLAENGRRPNIALVGGVGLFDGTILRDTLRAATREEAIAARYNATPSAATSALLGLARSVLRPAATETSRLVYLLGDSTPLYFRVPTLHHTTWDASPLGDALRQSGGDKARAAALLRERGVTHILINPSEIARLTADGWYDPLVTPAVAEDFVRGHGRELWRSSTGNGVRLLELVPDR